METLKAFFFAAELARPYASVFWERKEGLNYPTHVLGFILHKLVVLVVYLLHAQSSKRSHVHLED